MESPLVLHTKTKSSVNIPVGYAHVRIHDQNLIVKTDSFEWVILSDAALESLRLSDIDTVFQRRPLFVDNYGHHSEVKRESQYCTKRAPNNQSTVAPEIVILHTSNACNLRCKYCYADAGIGRAMSPDIARCVIDRVSKHSNQPCILEFHGGEPLLNFEFIRQTINYADTKTTKDGNPLFSYSLQTNGTLITNEIADFLALRHVSTGVSIDGFDFIHDSCRVFPDGSGSYHQVIAGIRKLQHAGVPFSTMSVILDLSALDNLLPFAIYHNLDLIKISNYLRQGRATIEPQRNWSSTDFAERILTLVDRIIEHNRSTDSHIRLENIRSLLFNILTKQRGSMCMRFPCGAGNSMIAVDIDGSVYPCEEMVGKPELTIGNILEASIEQVMSEALAVELRNRNIEQFERCPDCYLKSVCVVSCANESYNINQRFTNISEYCQYYKVMVPGLIWRIHNDTVGIATLL